jgi:hypothetical protein
MNGARLRCGQQTLLDNQRPANLLLEEIAQPRGLAGDHRHALALLVLFLHFRHDLLDLAAEARTGREMARQRRAGRRDPPLQIAIAQQ